MERRSINPQKWGIAFHMDQAEVVSGASRTLRFYTTDIDAYLRNADVYGAWIESAGIRPPQTLLGVARLATRETLIEIEAEAAD